MPRTTPSSATPPASAIDRKIALFKAEVAGRHLSTEQKAIYDVFIRTKGNKPRFEVIDKDGNKVSFRIDPSKRNDGPQHILTKHYKGSIGRVTASEILNMLEVIRRGTRRETPNHIAYSLTKKTGNVKYTIALKLTRKDRVLKSFYSDRRQ